MQLAGLDLQDELLDLDQVLHLAGAWDPALDWGWSLEWFHS